MKNLLMALSSSTQSMLTLRILISTLFAVVLLTSNVFGLWHGLYTVYERPQPWPPAGSPINHVILTNGSWHDAYRITVTDAKVNDILRIRGHITFTNTKSDRVYGECRITVNGSAVGTKGKISVTYKLPPVANTLANESRDHAPVFSDGCYVVQLAGDYNGDGAVNAADYVVWRKIDGTQAGYDVIQANFGKTAATATYTITIKLQSSATNPGGLAPDVLVENGHGHLIVEHYRSYGTVAETVSDSARVLGEYYYQLAPQLVNYPSSPPVGQEYDTIKTWPDINFAYQMDIPVVAGDRIRFFGMATCFPIYPNQVHDGPVLGIWKKDPSYTAHTLYSPWIAEGFSPAYTVNPMWNDTITEINTSGGTNRYWLSVHGTLVRPQGIGGQVSNTLGYLYALLYRLQIPGGGVPGGRYLKTPYETTTGATWMPADGTWQTLISRVIPVESNEIVKLAGAALFEHPGTIDEMITTNMILRIRNSLGTVVAQSPISYKHLSKYTKYNSIRSDLITMLNAGNYYFELLANCPDAVSPTVNIDPSGTKLYFEGFNLLGGANNVLRKNRPRGRSSRARSTQASSR